MPGIFNLRKEWPSISATGNKSATNVHSAAEIAATPSTTSLFSTAGIGKDIAPNELL